MLPSDEVAAQQARYSKRRTRSRAQIRGLILTLLFLLLVDILIPE